MQLKRCRNGHEMVPENTMKLKDGYDRCRQCHQAHCRKHYREHLAHGKVGTFRNCQVCGRQFISYRATQKYCNLKCMEAHRSKTRPPRPKKPTGNLPGRPKKTDCQWQDVAFKQLLADYRGQPEALKWIKANRDNLTADMADKTDAVLNRSVPFGYKDGGEDKDPRLVDQQHGRG